MRKADSALSNPEHAGGATGAPRGRRHAKPREARADFGPERESTCLVVYDSLVHYRYGVFRELDASAHWRFTYAAGASSRDGSIKSIPPSLLRATVPLSNRWLGPALWQHGLVHHALFGDFDIAIMNGAVANITTWLAALIFRLRGRPVYFWTIGWHRPEGGVKKIVRRMFYALADELLLYGEDAARIGEMMGYPQSRMHVIGNSIVSSEAVDIRPEEEPIPHFEAESDVLVVGAVARLTPEKRFDLLVEAVADMRARGEKVQILLVGDGPVRKQLETLASRLQVPISLPGAIHSAAGLRRVYKVLDVTVLPERAGLTVMQSMENGVPVVTVDDPYRQVPEFRAVRDGLTGALYRPDDLQDLIRALATVREMLASQGEKLAAECRSEVRTRWSPEVHARTILGRLEAGQKSRSGA